MTNVPAGYQTLINQMSKATGLPTAVIAAQANDESGFNSTAVSSAGAEGWLQFMPTTYNSIAAQAGVARGTEFNPQDESKAYDVYMNQLLSEEHGSVQDALAAYNAGPGDLAAGMGYANSILSAAGTGDITVKGGTGGSGTGGGTGGSTGSATGILDSFPGGALDPLNWPSEVGNAGTAAGNAISGEITSGIGSGIESAITGVFGNIMQNLGFKSGKDFLIRISLIIMGAIILIIGIKSLANSGSSALSGVSIGSGGGEGSASDESDNSTSAGGSNSASSGNNRRSAAAGSSSTIEETSVVA
jgi:hypothetical protein